MDQLDYLDRVGFEIYDSFTKTTAQLHAKLLLVLSDFRGLQSILKCGGSPSTHGCLKCWLRATKKAFNGSGKTIYAGHRVFLPPNHPLRTPLTLLHNTTQQRPRMNDRSDIRYRKNEEILLRFNQPDQAMGPLGPRFPGILYTTSFIYDLYYHIYFIYN